MDDTGSDYCRRDNSVKFYEMEWINLSKKMDIVELQEDAINGKLRNSRFRSICWRLFLNILPPDSSKWLTIIEESRTKYKIIQLNNYNDPHTQDSGPDNPLSQDDNSIWNKYYKETQFKKIIQQDVVRTFPDNTYFKEDNIQKMMLNILFLYSMEHPNLCYRQGMHEILAPLLFVLDYDYKSLLHVSKHLSSVENLIQILNPAYFEADAYVIFENIMEIIKDAYNFNDNVMYSSEHLEAENIINSTNESEVSRKLSKISIMLSKHDPELYRHLLDLEICFPTFGICWLRLLFGREFSLDDLLVLWDSIFAKSYQNVELVNHIFVAMLVLLRVQLLKSDNSNCLNCLMNSNVDVMSVISYALHMSDPETYILPSVITSLKHDTTCDNLKTNIINHKINIPERPSRFVNNTSHNLLEELSDRVKLQNYYAILNPMIPNTNIEGRRALDGIKELCRVSSFPSRPGVIEMGKDVLQNTSQIQAPPHTPETPEASSPVLPPPATTITMKVFSRTEKSSELPIIGAPNKNPLKLLKRFEQNDRDVVRKISCSDLKIDELAKEVFETNINTVDEIAIQGESIDIEKQNFANTNSVVKFIQIMPDNSDEHSNKQNHVMDLISKKCSIQRDCTSSTVGPNIQKLDKKTKRVNSVRQKKDKVSKIISNYPKPECAYAGLIGIALKNSRTGFMVIGEIYEFLRMQFPFFEDTTTYWKNSIRKCLNENLYFHTDATTLPINWNKKLKWQDNISWYINQQTANKLELIIRNWSHIDPISAKKTMKFPESLNILVQGRSIEDVDHNSEFYDLLELAKFKEIPEIIPHGTNGNYSTVSFENFANIILNNTKNEEEVSDSLRLMTFQEMLEEVPHESNENYLNISDKNVDITFLNDINHEEENKIRKPIHMKRPLNAFMIWSKGERMKIVKENRFVNQIESSIILGKKWNKLTVEEKAPYFLKAKILKKKHELENPNYKYTPKRKKKMFFDN